MLELAPEGFEERERGAEVDSPPTPIARRLAHRAGLRLRAEDDVPSDWAERWRTFHRPVRAGPF